MWVSPMGIGVKNIRHSGESRNPGCGKLSGLKPLDASLCWHDGYWVLGKGEAESLSLVTRSATPITHPHWG